MQTQEKDERIDRGIGVILRTGVMLAALFVAAGGIYYLAGHAATPPSFAHFQGAPPAFTHIRSIAKGATSLDPLFIIQLGLIVLMATPVVRVIACAVGFAWEKDWTYVVVSLIVLAALLVSLVGHSG